jgi:hypothetical protein
MGSGARDGEETSLVSPRSSRRFLSLMSRRRARQSVVLASSVPEGPVLEGVSLCTAAPLVEPGVHQLHHVERVGEMGDVSPSMWASRSASLRARTVRFTVCDLGCF